MNKSHWLNVATTTNESLRDEQMNARRRGAREAVSRERRWSVVLAGGDGVGLRGLTRLVCRDDRPKHWSQPSRSQIHGLDLPGKFGFEPDRVAAAAKEQSERKQP